MKQDKLEYKHSKQYERHGNILKGVFESEWEGAIPKVEAQRREVLWCDYDFLSGGK